ncbi:ABC transporter permease [Comamonas sp. HJ-2]
MGETTLARSFAIQLRVIHALLLREVITRYGRHGLGFLWLFLEPMLFTLGVATLWTVANMHAMSDIPIIAFAITGYSSVLMWRNVANRCSKAIEPNMALMYHRNVRILDIFMSRVLLEWVGATASFIALSALAIVSGFMRGPQDIFIIAIGWIMLAWFSIGLGFTVGVLSEKSETFERIWHIATYLMFPLSGAAFMVDWLPTAAQKIVLYLPMVHGVEMIRHGFFGEVVKTHENPSYMAFVSLLLLLIGLALVKDASRNVKPE